MIGAWWTSGFTTRPGPRTGERACEHQGKRASESVRRRMNDSFMNFLVVEILVSEEDSQR
jgi:hypothetical protein